MLGNHTRGPGWGGFLWGIAGIGRSHPREQGQGQTESLLVIASGLEMVVETSEAGRLVFC